MADLDLAAAAPEVTASAPVVTPEAVKPATAESKETGEETLLGKTQEDASKPEAKVEPVAKVVVPEKYEVKVPEGMTIDQGLLDVVTPIFKELNLPQESVQKLVDAYAPHVNSMLEAQKQQAVDGYKAITKEWEAETVKELGKDASKELVFASKFIDKYGSNEVRKLLNETGIGNNVHIAKLFIAAGKAISSDSFPDSGRKGSDVVSEEEAGQRLFPSSKK